MINKEAIGEIKKHKGMWLALLVYAVCGAVLIVAQAYGIAFLVDKSFMEKQSLATLKMPLYLTAGVIFFRALLFYFQQKKARHVGSLIKMELRKKVTEHMLALGIYGKGRHGEVIFLLSDGLEHIEEYVVRYLPQMTYALIIPLIMAIAIVDAIPWVSLILLITYPLIPFFMILIGKSAAKLNQKQWRRMNVLSGHFLDVLQGIETLKLFNRSKEQLNVIARLSAEFRDATLSVLRVAFLSALVLELVSTISTALIAVYTGFALLYGEVSFFSAFFILLLAPDFYAPLRQLGTFFHTGMSGNTAFEALQAYLDIMLQEPGAKTEKLEETIEAIHIEDLSYTYPERTSLAVENIHFVLNKERRVVLIGESGAGKSTVGQLLLRLLEPSKGRIMVNDRNLLSLDGEWWREQVAVVPQRPYIQRGTIRENILLGREATEEEIYQAIRLAKAEEFINGLPDGIDTILGEGGTGLSGGEKQRLSIARAMLKPSSVVVLDEAGAHLDVETEMEVKEGLNHLCRNKLVLLITHRRSSIIPSDEVIVMEDGKVVARGEAKQLDLQMNVYLKGRSHFGEKGGEMHEFI